MKNSEGEPGRGMELCSLRFIKRAAHSKFSNEFMKSSEEERARKAIFVAFHQIRCSLAGPVCQTTGRTTTTVVATTADTGAPESLRNTRLLQQ